MRYLSVCSGIEAASVAWHPLGWEPVAFSEIDAFPSAVLAERWPGVPNWGDMERFHDWPDAAIDLLVGGTPCQSFSVAGLRKGLADPRGNLALTYLAIADRYRPRWLLWENVPGVLSAYSHDAPDPSPPDIDLGAGDGPGDGEEIVVEDCYDADENHAFSCILAGLQELGYGFAYRILDAQHCRVDGFGRAVPQRRRRVYVVGYLGDWRRAAAVLLEPEGLPGNPAPRRKAGQGTARNVAPCLDANFGRLQGASGQDLSHGRGHLVAFGGNDTRGSIDVATALSAHGGPHGRVDFESETFVARAPRAEGFDASEDGTGRGTPLAPVAFTAQDYGGDAGETAPTPRAGGHGGSHANNGVMPAVAVPINLQLITRGKALGQGSGFGLGSEGDPAFTLVANHSHGVFYGGVRRLTPRECERLQGFPDDYTAISYRGKPATDGPRYKALGNSMPVNVMRWIGRRIDMVEALAAELGLDAGRAA